MAGAPTPPLIQEAFASSAGAGYITNPIPVPSQIGITAGRASYTDGFPPLTMAAPSAGGVNPFGQDMNGILFALSANIAALSGGQNYQFNATWATANSGYAIGSVVAMASGKGFWINLTNGNTNNPDTSAAGSGWVPLCAYGTTAISGLTNANVTLTAAQAALPMIVFSGTLTANVQIIFPTWTNRWVIVNSTSGGYSLTCKTASGSGIVIPQGGYTNASYIYGDGTNIRSLYLPINSGLNWIQFPTGQIYQWGQATMIASSPGTTITFPIKFPTNVQSVQLTAYGGPATVEVLTQSATNFTGINGTGGLNNWVAIGY